MTVYALTQEQKAKTRYYLGYFNLQTRSFMESVPIPIVIAQQGVLENNMNQILDQYSLTLITDLISQIECSRAAINEARTRLVATEVAGTVKLNRYELNQRWAEDLKLCLELANLLATPLYWHPTGVGIGGPGGGVGGPLNPNMGGGMGGGSIPLLD